MAHRGDAEPAVVIRMEKVQNLPVIIDGGGMGFKSFGDSIPFFLAEANRDSCVHVAAYAEENFCLSFLPDQAGDE